LFIKMQQNPKTKDPLLDFLTTSSPVYLNFAKKKQGLSHTVHQ
jgi:hypothetical protein